MDFETFSVLIAEFYERNHRYSRDDEGLRAALAISLGAEAVKDRHPSDPWGRPYLYRAKQSGPPDVYSLAPNGADEHGQGDDIAASMK
jgi:hypothetical protein